MKAHTRAGERGYGQVVYAADGTPTWPAGVRVRSDFRFDDTIDDQLRHGIAWSRSSTRQLAAAAGVRPAVVDRFMAGADALTFAQAARLARVLGLRLADQSVVEGFLRAWRQAGEPVLRCPRNRIAAAAARRR